MVSSVFDPLGILAPLTLPVKQLLQQLCKEGYGWDEPVPSSQSKQWLNWIHDLPKLTAFSVPRCQKPNEFGKPQSLQLHHFATGFTDEMRMIIEFDRSPSPKLTLKLIHKSRYIVCTYLFRSGPLSSKMIDN